MKGHLRNPPGKNRSGQAGSNQVVDEGRGMTIRADAHTQAAVRADYTPVVQTRFNFQLPFVNAPHRCNTAFRDGSGGAVGGALLTLAAEILYAEVYWFISQERQVGSDRAQPDPGAEPSHSSPES